MFFRLKMEVIPGVAHEYGYVVLVVLATFLLNIWMTIKVVSLRSKLKIEYPVMYDDSQNLYNCYQRVHQNTLENMPFFLVTLILGGFRLPFLELCGSWPESSMPGDITVGILKNEFLEQYSHL